MDFDQGVYKVKWGIIGCGHIANAFCLSLIRLNSPRHKLVAVASKSSNQKATEFASKFKIDRAYGSYEELIFDSKINAVYIANLTTAHVEPAIAAMKAGKAVLVEKPMAMSAADCRSIIECSRLCKVLCVEAVWSRFMPPFERIRQLIGQGHKPMSMVANYAVPFQHVERLMKPELGGGVLRDIGMYAVELATMIWGNQAPLEILATGFKNKHGVDQTSAVIVKYDEGIATILVDSRAGARNLTEARIYFAPGSEFSSAKICAPFYVSTRIELTRSSDNSVKVEEYPIYPDLPPPPPGLAFHNPASQALAYEAEAFADIFQKWMETRGKDEVVIEHPLRTHKETLIDSEIVDKALDSWLNK